MSPSLEFISISIVFNRSRLRESKPMICLVVDVLIYNPTAWRKYREVRPGSAFDKFIEYQHIRSRSEYHNRMFFFHNGYVLDLITSS